MRQAMRAWLKPIVPSDPSHDTGLTCRNVLAFLLALAGGFWLAWNGAVWAQSRTSRTNVTEAASSSGAGATSVGNLPIIAAASEVPGIQGELIIFAAASLADAFKEMAADIARANPGAKLIFNFVGSPTLRTQLAQGARADIFASADEPTMHGAEQDGTIASAPRLFARNLLVVVVPVNNPGGIDSLRDLAKPKVKLILAHKEVPVGNYSRQALARMSQDPAFGADFATRVLANLVSEETNVKQVAAKVQLGEADAGIVYATDVTPTIRHAVKLIDIPPEFNVMARYPIAIVKGARNREGARAFVEYVVSPAGQAILGRYGFLVAGS